MIDSARIFGPRRSRNSHASRWRGASGVKVIAALGASALALAGCSQADDAADAAHNAADSASEAAESATESTSAGQEEKLTFDKQQVADFLDGRDVQPARQSRLRQEHGAELARADQTDGDGLSGRFAFQQ